MRKRKKPEDVLKVTSFRLPQDVKDFLHAKAAEMDRTMSYILVDYLRMWRNYEIEKKKQPRTK